MSIDNEPWAYVAHKDGKLGGVAAASLGKDDLGEFLGDFAADGYTLATVFNREEYLALTAGMDWVEQQPKSVPAP